MYDNAKSGATPFSRELIAKARALLADHAPSLRTQHDGWKVGSFQLDVYAPGIGGSVRQGDELHAGFSLAHDPAGRTHAAARLYRVVCENGAIVPVAMSEQAEFDSEVPSFDWEQQLAYAVAASFDPERLNEHIDRLQHAARKPVAELSSILGMLQARRQITMTERVYIEHLYEEESDPTLYGVMNAVTAAAHMLRAMDQWDRAAAIERIGGEIGLGSQALEPQLV